MRARAVFFSRWFWCAALTLLADFGAAATASPPPRAPLQFTYATARAFPSLSFASPLALVTPPGETRRLFIVERTGRIWVIPDVTAASPTRTLFLNLSTQVATSSDPNDERGLLALAFHPDYVNNGRLYVWYTVTTTTGGGSGLHDRLARFRVSPADPDRADPASEEPLITQFDRASNHNGGQILFGPDGYLYLSIGDEGDADDTFLNSQRIDRNFFSAVLRLDVDQRPGSLPPNPHPAVHAGTYAIPADNPFVGARSFGGLPVSPTAVRTEFWAVGLRNPWRMAFDPDTGRLWCGDVGQGAREEIDVIVRGGNYGWSYREGTIAGPRPNPPAAAGFLPPIWDYPRTEGECVIGGLLYRGTRYPELAGRYVFTDFSSGRIWSLQPEGENPVGADAVQLLATDGGIASFGLDPSNGDILLADLAEGAIKRLVATSTDPSHFINLAARAPVGTDANVLIPGFVIAPGASKTVLIRGVGPKLADFGVNGALAQPVLTLLSGSAVIAANTRWNSAANAAELRATAARVGAFALPEGSADSALVMTLAPGAYTAQVAGLSGSTGVALVEIYDADAASAPAGSRLINIAVRAQVGTGANLLIPGLVVGEGAPKNVLLRAVGPGLAAFGVAGLLAQPTLTLFQGSRALLANAGWNSAANAADIRSAAERLGTFALAEGSRDSALLTTLGPGAYTLLVAGANNTSGIALVEVYEVP